MMQRHSLLRTNKPFACIYACIHQCLCRRHDAMYVLILRSSVWHACMRAQIMALSTMKDGERLELLKEIGGTKVYEERRRESLKILQETDNRRARIQEVVRRPAGMVLDQGYLVNSVCSTPTPADCYSPVAGQSGAKNVHLT